MGIVSIVFGVIGLITSFLYIGLIFGVVGVTLGIVGLADYLSEKELPLVGLLISILGIVVSIYVFVSDIDAHKLVIAYVRDPEPVIEVEAETKAGAEYKLISAEKPEAEPEMKPEAASEMKLEAEPRIEQEIESMTNPELEAVAEAEEKSDFDPIIESESEPFIEVQTDYETESEWESMPEQIPKTSIQEQAPQSSDYSSVQLENGEYQVGQTWTVPGQWNLTIDSVVETTERNQNASERPQAVYVVTYTYENLGYQSSRYGDSLYMSIESQSVIDHNGEMGYRYIVRTGMNPQGISTGGKCEAKGSFGVDNAGSFKIYFEQYDGSGTKQKATFVCDVN